jgi:hypothetical protein
MKEKEVRKIIGNRPELQSDLGYVSVYGITESPNPPGVIASFIAPFDDTLDRDTALTMFRHANVLQEPLYYSWLDQDQAGAPIEYMLRVVAAQPTSDTDVRVFVSISEE